MTIVSRWDAVVVGAGPAGSAVGLSLARAGAAVLLLDRATFPRDKPCSEYLSPAATPLLARLDPAFIPEIESATPGRLFGMRIVAPDGRSAVGRFERLSIDSTPGIRPYGYAVPRTVLDSTLLRGARRAGAVIEEGAQAEELLYDQGSVAGVVVRRPGGQRHALRARVVVGADGLRSIVARRLGLRRRSRPERVAFTAHFRGVAAVGDVGEMHVGQGGSGYVGLGPIGDGVTTTALVLSSRVARQRAAELRRGAKSLIHALNQFPRLRDRFADAELVREVLVTGPFAQWSRRSVAPGGGALLVGDAADFFDPFTGQGLYSALRGAELAAQVIVAALADQSRGPLGAATLAPYAAARRRAFAGKWILERLIGIGVGWPWLAARVIDRLARHPALADLLVGATGNIVPARAVLAPANLFRLLA